ncbi:MAG: hypothetical protein ACKPDI_13225 [Actinomycetota bacterium]
MIIAFGSWRGTGATTAALLLAACAAEHGDAWLLEADPAGGVLAGRLQLPSGSIGGLERVAFPAQAGAAGEVLQTVAHRTGGLRVVSCPADPFRAHACHLPRQAWARSLRELPGTVVVDVGRLRAGTPVGPVLAAADVLLLVSSPEVCAAVGSIEWLHAAGVVAPGERGVPDLPVRLLVVDAPGGVAFAEPTLRADLGEHWGGWLPWQPLDVDLLHRGATVDDRRLRRSPLVQAARSVLQGVASLRPPEVPVEAVAPVNAVEPQQPAASPAVVREEVAA